MAERQTNYTIMEGYELPSKGLIYDEKVDSHVELRAMTARDEMKRLNKSSTPLKNLADIIEGCMIEKPAIHVYDMCLGDYEFLLHKVRIVTYGQDYRMILRCPSCGETVEVNTDLDDLMVKEFNLDDFEAMRTFTLPVKGDTVKLNFLTPRLLEEVEAKARDMKRKFKSADIDFDMYARLTLMLDTVNGNAMSQLDKEAYIDHLPARDMQKILNNMDKINSAIGLDTTMYVTCPKCGTEVKTFFRLGSEFFRPSNI